MRSIHKSPFKAGRRQAPGNQSFDFHVAVHEMRAPSTIYFLASLEGQQRRKGIKNEDAHPKTAPRDGSVRLRQPIFPLVTFLSLCLNFPFWTAFFFFHYLSLSELKFVISQTFALITSIKHFAPKL